MINDTLAFGTKSPKRQRMGIDLSRYNTPKEQENG